MKQISSEKGWQHFGSPLVMVTFSVWKDHRNGCLLVDNAKRTSHIDIMKAV